MQNDDQGAAPTRAVMLEADGATTGAGGVPPEGAAGGGEIVFIDTGVANWQTLADGVDPSAELVLVGAHEDGMQVIADTLAGRGDVQSVHILGHGSSGAFTLGGAHVNSGTLGEYAAELAAIKGALGADADLFLYGCNVGADGAGQAFVDALAELTGADVAASNDLTGSDALGGDWDMEVTTGTFDTGVVFSADALAAFGGTLPLFDITSGTVTGDGTGTFNQTLSGTTLEATTSGTFDTSFNDLGVDPNSATSFSVGLSGGASFTFGGLDWLAVDGDGDNNGTVDSIATDYIITGVKSGANDMVTFSADFNERGSVAAGDLPGTYTSLLVKETTDDDSIDLIIDNINLASAGPAAPTGLDLTTDTGTSSTDNLTSDNTPTITGYGDRGGIVG